MLLLLLLLLLLLFAITTAAVAITMLSAFIVIARGGCFVIGRPAMLRQGRDLLDGFLTYDPAIRLTVCYDRASICLHLCLALAQVRLRRCASLIVPLMTALTASSSWMNTPAVTLTAAQSGMPVCCDARECAGSGGVAAPVVPRVPASEASR